MKKSILFALMMIVALGATADRFYIEDLVISTGETLTVSIMLDNETAYTAFQTDVYLPEGLSVEQEDGDYLFDLTSRKARDHNIASQVQTDGAIRVMSYSPRINAYSGNSGALVTFNVTASEDFAGPTSIMLKNTLFTTTAGTEIPFSDETCNVTVPTTVQRGDVNGDGNINITDVTMLISAVMSDIFDSIITANADLYSDDEINITDVTTLINLILSSTD